MEQKIYLVKKTKFETTGAARRNDDFSSDTEASKFPTRGLAGWD